MKVYVTTTAIPNKYNPWAYTDLDRIKRLASMSHNQNHSIVEDPFKADVVLFCGSNQIYHSDILRSELFRVFRDKSMILDSSDCTLPLIPGLYASLTSKCSSASKAYYQGLPYFRVAENESLDDITPLDSGTTYLYSFVGKKANSQAIRGSILKINDDRAYLKDSFTGQKDGCLGYAQTLQSSKFILCPRGLGPSSWRIYEAMKAGRVPVIISDEWTPPVGIDWDSFSLRVPESDVGHIPSILRAIEDNSIEMGALARNQFHTQIGLHSGFDWLCARLEDIRIELGKSGNHCRRSRIIQSLISSDHIFRFTKEKAKELYWFASRMSM